MDNVSKNIGEYNLRKRKILIGFDEYDGRYYE